MANFLSNFLDSCHINLVQNDQAQSYLMSRGSNLEQWSRHQIGFCSDGFIPDLDNESCHSERCEDPDTKELCDACRFIKWSTLYEDGKKIVGGKLTNIVVYPITGPSGKVYGFQTRRIDMKVFDTFMLQKRPEPLFFGTAGSINNIWNSREVIITEGPSDMLVVERCLRPGVLAIMTNNVNSAQTKFIHRFLSKIILVLDLDAPGRNGAQSIINKFSNTHQIINVKYHHGNAKDPNELWQKLGDVKFTKHFAGLFL